ncbi:LOW QUALITY PROTEIN: hypothetical protein GQ55_7G151000 [Panicum hallii var. hallii]|uniref:Uncharacterized protein n=1 Tax=Panicum hallii var. hallii TaxID=1504633 RepID=A0A2T7CVA8_9POAL|nr:LOW QUALITY PROTEIN: hypothetical protein GQ55_7G151000 [Panicum hallii var. hallii]
MRGRVGPGLLASYQGRVFAQVLDLFEKGRPPDGGDGDEPHLLEDPATTEPRKARLVNAAVRPRRTNTSVVRSRTPCRRLGNCTSYPVHPPLVAVVLVIFCVARTTCAPCTPSASPSPGKPSPATLRTSSCAPCRSAGRWCCGRISSAYTLRSP